MSIYIEGSKNGLVTGLSTLTCVIDTTSKTDIELTRYCIQKVEYRIIFEIFKTCEIDFFANWISLYDGSSDLLPKFPKLPVIIKQN